MIRARGFMRHVAAAVFAFALAFAPAAHAEQSPVFGSANIAAMSNEAAQGVTARGAWADYFGGLALDFSYSAYIYNYYARYVATSNSATEQSWYLTASNQAYYAYLYSYYAYLYSAWGM